MLGFFLGPDKLRIQWTYWTMGAGRLRVIANVFPSIPDSSVHHDVGH